MGKIAHKIKQEFYWLFWKWRSDRQYTGIHLESLGTKFFQFKGEKSYADKGLLPSQVPSYLFLFSHHQFIPIQLQTSWGLNNSFQYNYRAFQFHTIWPLLYCIVLYWNTIHFELSNPDLIDRLISCYWMS